MKCFMAVFLIALILGASGCGGDPPKGGNRGKDKPVPADKKEE